ncbi:DUF4421 family protein [Flavobacterium hercynium]|uniref:DUF4421 domain-containing protein n=1 Tax=Flavobacterium hercynium TaxID=387094 RepID=A0A226HML7_9FLAO|nr:DUF4421 family protein [Flavobacterium hercynium]OXA94750.1 hypothetical protein B0A66_03205 [Flavobacterium hercynium]SMP07705.1 protein of unknown function [Flavobacterium hercynium]
MNLRLIILFLLVSTWNCFAQNDSISNIIDYDDKVIASLYQLETANRFDILSGKEANFRTVSIEPDYKSQLGVSLSYQFLNLSLSFAPDFFPGNKESRNAKLLSFNYTLFLKKWAQSFTFINQKGFYISEKGLSLPLPDMRTTKIGTTTSYIFNDNFSYKTLTSQNAWQRKSAGSFVPKLSFYYTNLTFNSDLDFSDGNMYFLSLAPTYCYNFVISNRFIIGSGIGFGAGINMIDEKVYGLYQFDFNFKLGYNKDDFFVFANTNVVSFFQSDAAQTRLDDTLSSFIFTIGYRFDAPKKVKKVYEKIHEKTGL